MMHIILVKRLSEKAKRGYPSLSERFVLRPQRKYGYTWDEMDCFGFLFNRYACERAFHEAFRGTLNITTADALLVMLEDYPFSKLREMHPRPLTNRIQAAYKKLYKISNPNFSYTLDSQAKLIS